MRRYGFLMVAGVLAGCPSDDTGGTPNDDGSESDSGTSCLQLGGMYPAHDASGCQPLGADYQPGVMDNWPSCAVDDGAYHLVEDTPSSIARVEAYEEILGVLRTTVTPAPDNFTEARVVYAQEEGLESRLQRREDLHFPPIPEADWEPGVDPDKQCTVAANVEKYPDRCAGPAKIAPLIIEEFGAGMTGDGDPLVHAARIDAAIIWFLYLSVYKEANTCVTSKAKDCDSSWAYYSGGFDRAGGIGFARHVLAVSPVGHEGIWNGFAAFRCWRELYPIDMFPAIDDVPSDGQTMRDNADAQLSDALVYGLSQVVRAATVEQDAACASEADANWAFLQVLGPVLGQAGAQRDAALNDQLQRIYALDQPTVDDLMTAVTTLDALFPCPQS